MPALSRVGTAFFLNKPGGAGGGGAAVGEAVFHADQGNMLNTWNQHTTYTWEVPTGVTEISVVCVGGGGSGQPEHDGASGAGGALAFKNNIIVVPGTNVSVYVGGGGFEQNWGGSYGQDGYDSYIQYNGTIYARAGGGSRADKNQANGYVDNSTKGVRGGDYDGGGDGGNGVAWNGCRQSGGGAGGYDAQGLTQSGTPGNVSYSGWSGKNGHGGGGGGGHSANGTTAYYSAGGGGVGVYGAGSSGACGDNTSTPSGVQSYTGKGGSYDPWLYEQNGLGPSLSSYNHYTGLRGYSVETPWDWWAAGSDLNGSSYRRDQETQGQGYTRPDGGFPGGGGGGGNSGHPAGAGGNGIVRIVWGTINGMKREFPQQGVNKTDVYPGLGGNTPIKYGNQQMY